MYFCNHPPGNRPSFKKWVAIVSFLPLFTIYVIRVCLFCFSHLPGLYLESERQSAQYSSPDIVTFRDSILSKDIVHLWLSTFKLSELCENRTKDPKGLWQCRNFSLILKCSLSCHIGFLWLKLLAYRHPLQRCPLLFYIADVVIFSELLCRLSKIFVNIDDRS